MERSDPAKVSIRAIVVLAAIAICVFIIDQVAKALVIAHLALGEQVHVIGDLLVLRYVRNPGAAFSIGTGSTWIFTIVAIGVLVFVIWYARRIRSAAWAVVFGLLLGGLLGNLCDRLLRPPAFGQGEVVDFVQIPLLPAIFNLADSAIVAAMALFLILTLRGIGLDGRRHVEATAAHAGTDAQLTTDAAAGTAASAETDAPAATAAPAGTAGPGPAAEPQLPGDARAHAQSDTDAPSEEHRDGDA